METKLEYAAHPQDFDACDKYFTSCFKNWVAACYHARLVAFKEVCHLKHSTNKVNLFWVVFDFEIRQFIEGMVRDNADL